VEEAWPTALHVAATDGDGGADVITTAAIVEGGGEAVVGGMAGVGYEAYPAPHAHHAHNNSHHAAAQYQYAGAEWGQYHPHPHQVLSLGLDFFTLLYRRVSYVNENFLFKNTKTKSAQVVQMDWSIGYRLEH
jgi:hypothetical protein